MDPSDTSTADTPQQRRGAAPPAVPATTPLPRQDGKEGAHELDAEAFDETHVVRGYD